MRCTTAPSGRTDMNHSASHSLLQKMQSLLQHAMGLGTQAS
jgi:hypothetical protein